MNENNFYKGNPLLPRAGIRRELTEWEKSEFIKCAQDPVYFANNYFYAVHQKHGLMQIKLYDYQVEALEKYNEVGRLIMLTARQVGKALALSTKVPLYEGGFTTIGDLKIGDYIIGSNGKATKVTFKSEIHNKPTYKVSFETGEEIVACEDHLWTVYDTFTPRGRYIKTLTTKEMFEKVSDLKRRGSVENRYKIANIKPVEYADKEVKIDPYTLGAWLGDGSSGGAAFTCATPHKMFYEEQGIEFTSEIGFDKNPERVYTSSIKMLGSKLKVYNLINNKHIPEEYLYNSIEVRRAVLQGLMDTDGYINTKGRCDISIAEHRHPQLIEDISILLNSLGFKVYRSRAFSKKYGTWHTRFMFMATQNDQVFRIPYKKDRLRKTLNRDPKFRYINNIIQIENEPTQCITVDADDHLFAITDSYILTHNTTVATAIILHTALFNKNKNIALLANLQATAIEILDRIKEAFENLPDFLKQGIRIWNKKTIKFENGCTIFANASKGSSIRGKSIFMLYIDECAFVDDWSEFAASTLPTITSNDEAKIIYTSTPRGLNHFYEYCTLAKNKKNGFEYVEVPWYKVDGRDEKWKQKTLEDMNFDEERFEVEQNCQFMGSSGTLINGATLKLLEAKQPYHIHDNLKIFKPKVGNHIYALIVDSSEGKGLDYSAFSVIDITSVPYEQVATFRSNQITPQDYARIIHTVSQQYNEPFILVELNAPAGAIVAEILFWDFEYENILMTEGAGRAGKKISSGFGGGKKDRGIFTSTAVKATGCTMLKLLIEQRQLIVNDKETIFELQTFSKKGKSYEAEEGKHDDLVMGLVLFGWLSTQQYFKQITDVDINHNLKEILDKDIEDYVRGMGIMVVNDGIDEYMDADPVW